MRYYLIIGKPNVATKEALSIFEEKGSFNCAGTITAENASLVEDFKYPPHLVFVDLDYADFDVYEIIAKLNCSLGMLPHYIGITNSPLVGFNAFKNKFADVVLAPFDTDSIVNLLLKYSRNFTKNLLFCVESYFAFQYINLKDVVLLRADRYVTQFVLKDGSSINNFKNLKGTHQLLPINFQRIHRSYVVNALYVYRIHSGRQLLYLRHYIEPLRFSKKYSPNIVEIKRILTGLSIPS